MPKYTCTVKAIIHIILLPNNRIVDYGDGTTDAAPDALIGIKNSNIPVISRTGDPHDAKKYNQVEFCEKNNGVCIISDGSLYHQATLAGNNLLYFTPYYIILCFHF